MTAQFECANMRGKPRTSSTFHSAIKAAVSAAQLCYCNLDTSLAFRGKRGCGPNVDCVTMGVWLLEEEQTL